MAHPASIAPARTRRGRTSCRASSSACADALGLPTLLSAYGATNPAEFFAVATETYFDRPVEMRQHHPDLYSQLEGYYGPAETLVPAEPGIYRV